MARSAEWRGGCRPRPAGPRLAGGAAPSQHESHSPDEPDCDHGDPRKKAAAPGSCRRATRVSLRPADDRSRRRQRLRVHSTSTCVDPAVSVHDAEQVPVYSAARPISAFGQEPCAFARDLPRHDRPRVLECSYEVQTSVASLLESRHSARHLSGSSAALDCGTIEPTQTLDRELRRAARR